MAAIWPQKTRDSSPVSADPRKHLSYCCKERNKLNLKVEADLKKLNSDYSQSATKESVTQSIVFFARYRKRRGSTQ